jgi:hypothetical protein
MVEAAATDTLAQEEWSSLAHLGWLLLLPTFILSGPLSMVFLPDLLSHMSVISGNALTDAPRVCFTNLLGVSSPIKVTIRINHPKTFYSWKGEKNWASCSSA